MLKELLPDRLREIPQLRAVLDAEEPEAQAAQAAVHDFLAQLNVDTATWGLELWEWQYGIETNVSRTYEERRGSIKAKMRGAATTTARQLERVIDSYVNGQSAVTEYPALYKVSIQFNGDYGVPSNLDDCKRAVREILPAHVDADYFFKYLLIKDIHKVMTLGDMERPLSHFAFRRGSE